jgi:transmembrane sensor
MSEGRGGRIEGDRSMGEAIDWLVENESDVATDHARLSKWIKWSAHPDNRTAYADAIRMREDLRSLARPFRVSRKDLLGDVADDPDAIVVRSECRLDGVDSGEAPAIVPLHRRISFGVRLLAVAVVAISFVLGAVFLAADWSFMAERTYATAAGEQREVVLTDGSLVTLGGDTLLNVRYTAQARIIELERGAALFRVQHDPNRPFVVRSDRGTTTAVGTEFEVRRYTDHVQVWVREGAVVVAPLKETAVNDAALVGARLTPVRLSEGQELTYDIDGKPTAPRRADPHITAAWTEGRLVPLVYRSRPLPEVIEDIQPYTRRRIVIDSTVAGLRYTGIVKQEDADAWLHDLVTIYPVEVIDCRLPASRAAVRGCTRPEYVVIRSTVGPWQADPRSALR